MSTATRLKFLSLFSGIGGFDMALERAGMTCDAVVEINMNAQNILRRHFPNARLYNDVKEVGNATHAKKSIDLICGGFPCQDVSIAGKRAGLAGERSGLWFEFARIIDELEPQWVVIENVPGLLSSNKGRDIQIIIDTLTQMGYTCDIDIKDAQEFGVAQRRRRVFLTCVRLDGLLQQRTNLSRQISADLLVQILLNAWGATQQVSPLVPLHSVYEKPIERCVNLLNKTMSLLDRTRERLVCKKYQNNLGVLLDQFGGEDKNLESGLIRKSEIQKDENSGKTVMYPFDLKAENGDTSISLCLNEYLVAVCKTESQFTTSISTNRITDHQIYIFAVMALLIVKRILLSTDWSESCWSVVSTLSILLQENMNYARQASRNLFIESGLRDSWRDYLNTASNIQNEIERRTGIIRERQVLFERESSPGDTPPSREKGQGVAYSIRANPSHSGDKGDGGINTTLIANAISTNPANRLSGEDNYIAGTLHNGFPGRDASDAADNKIFTWNWPSGGEVRHDFNEKPMLQSSQVPAVGVRRLTPTECERLQGFPDGWTGGQSDSTRYRQLGNAVAVPVVKWIARRIMEVLK